MSSQSIAVIDDSELKDGEMCVSHCGPPVLVSLTDLREWQEGGFVRRWKGTAFASRRPSTCNECILYPLRSTPGQRSSDSGRKGGVVSLTIYLLGTLAYGIQAHGTEVVSPFVFNYFIVDTIVQHVLTSVPVTLVSGFSPSRSSTVNNDSNHNLEDAPALDALHSFKASVQDGKIYVTADPKRTLKDNKARPPVLSTEGVAAPGKGVLIVGGGAGAINTVESLREASLDE